MSVIISSFRTYKKWWIVLLSISVILAVWGQGMNIPSIVGGIVGHLLIAFIIALIPLLGYKLFRNPLNENQFMWIYTIAFVLMAMSIITTTVYKS